MHNTEQQHDTAVTIRIQDLLEEDHDRLDDLFSSYREAKDEDPDRAGRLLDQFARELHHHIEWEDEKLFSLYEEQVQPLGLTRSMRADHREILRIVETIRERWANGYHRDTAWNEGRLRSILDRHNAKEEDELYPELNELLSVERKRALAEAFSDRINDEHR